MGYYGFKTAKGSIYAFNLAGETIRWKNSNGKDQHKIHDASMCLFVCPKADDAFDQHYFHGNQKYNAITFCATDSHEKVFPFTGGVSLQKGHTPIVAIVERATLRSLVFIQAVERPVIGYTPVELRHDGKGLTFTHIGNPIVEIYHSRKELTRNAPPELLAAEGLPERTNIFTAAHKFFGRVLHG